VCLRRAELPAENLLRAEFALPFDFSLNEAGVAGHFVLNMRCLNGSKKRIRLSRDAFISS
jgi:hypothetical protein